MKRLLGLGSVMALLGALSGCGDDADDGPPGDDGPPLEQVPALYAAAICEAYENCFGPLFDVVLRGEDCLTRTATRLEDDLPRLEAAIEAGRIVYRSDEVEDCTREVAALDCANLNERESATCRSVLDGTLQTGAYCAMNEECRGVSFCKFEDSCPGTCASLEPEGGRCNDDSNCESGLVCSDQTGRCVTPKLPGTSCEEDAGDCEPGSLCVGADADENRAGTCRAFDEVFVGAHGDDCDPVASELCIPGQVCRVTSATQAGIQATCDDPVSAGAACELAFPDACPAGQYCAISTGTLSGTCRARPAAGSPCALTFEGEPSICEPYARCDGQTCRPLGHVGDSCTNHDGCFSEQCVAGKCAASEGCE